MVSSSAATLTPCRLTSGLPTPRSHPSSSKRTRRSSSPRRKSRRGSNERQNRRRSSRDTERFRTSHLSPRACQSGTNASHQRPLVRGGRASPTSRRKSCSVERNMRSLGQCEELFCVSEDSVERRRNEFVDERRYRSNDASRDRSEERGFQLPASRHAADEPGLSRCVGKQSASNSDDEDLEEGEEREEGEVSDDEGETAEELSGWNPPNPFEESRGASLNGRFERPSPGGHPQHSPSGDTRSFGGHPQHSPSGDARSLQHTFEAEEAVCLDERRIDACHAEQSHPHRCRSDDRNEQRDWNIGTHIKVFSVSPRHRLWGSSAIDHHRGAHSVTHHRDVESSTSRDPDARCASRAVDDACRRTSDPDESCSCSGRADAHPPHHPNIQRPSDEFHERGQEQLAFGSERGFDPPASKRPRMEQNRCVSPWRDRGDTPHSHFVPSWELDEMSRHPQPEHISAERDLGVRSSASLPRRHIAHQPHQPHHAVPSERWGDSRSPSPRCSFDHRGRSPVRSFDGHGRSPSRDGRGRGHSRGRSSSRDGRGRSPRSDGRGRSPRSDGRGRSPRSDGRGRSPSRDGRDRNPSRDGRGRSPSRDGRGRSPSRDGRGRSLNRNGRGRSPSRDDRGRSPSRDDRGRSPSRVGRGRSPSRVGRGRSPSRDDRGRSPSYDAPGRSPNRNACLLPRAEFPGSRRDKSPGLRWEPPRSSMKHEPAGLRWEPPRSSPGQSSGDDQRASHDLHKVPSPESPEYISYRSWHLPSDEDRCERRHHSESGICTSASKGVGDRIGRHGFTNREDVAENRRDDWAEWRGRTDVLTGGFRGAGGDMSQDKHQEESCGHRPETRPVSTTLAPCHEHSQTGPPVLPPQQRYPADVLEKQRNQTEYRDRKPLKWIPPPVPTNKAENDHDGANQKSSDEVVVLVESVDEDVAAVVVAAAGAASATEKQGFERGLLATHSAGSPPADRENPTKNSAGDIMVTNVDEETRPQVTAAVVERQQDLAVAGRTNCSKQSFVSEMACSASGEAGMEQKQIQINRHSHHSANVGDACSKVHVHHATETVADQTRKAAELPKLHDFSLRHLWLLALPKMKSPKCSNGVENETCRKRIRSDEMKLTRAVESSDGTMSAQLKIGMVGGAGTKHDGQSPMDSFDHHASIVSAAGRAAVVSESPHSVLDDGGGRLSPSEDEGVGNVGDALRAPEASAVGEAAEVPHTLYDEDDEGDSSDSSSDEDSDEDVKNWVSKMLLPQTKQDFSKRGTNSSMDAEKTSRRLKLRVVPHKVGAQRQSANLNGPIYKTDSEASESEGSDSEESSEGYEEGEFSSQNRGRDARPLTCAELRAIMATDDAKGRSRPKAHWVRRSARQPSRSALTTNNMRSLVDKLEMNDSDMVVLKLKKYLSDPDSPCVVIDAALDALGKNTNCQALYIQNFNEGMRDDQVLKLLRILQRPECRIWCLNIGETYKVSSKTWSRFTRGLKKTKITHMYASEHTISVEMKEKIRDTIRENRKKHNLHMDPDNLDVIVQCTHCWWNPINASMLRPYLRTRGFEHLLYDKVGQGLKEAGASNTSAL